MKSIKKCVCLVACVEVDRPHLISIQVSRDRWCTSKKQKPFLILVQHELKTHAKKSIFHSTVRRLEDVHNLHRFSTLLLCFILKVKEREIHTVVFFPGFYYSIVPAYCARVTSQLLVKKKKKSVLLNRDLLAQKRFTRPNEIVWPPNLRNSRERKIIYHKAAPKT